MKVGVIQVTNKQVYRITGNLITSGAQDENRTHDLRITSALLFSFLVR